MVQVTIETIREALDSIHAQITTLEEALETACQMVCESAFDGTPLHEYVSDLRASVEALNGETIDDFQESFGEDGLQG